MITKESKYKVLCPSENGEDKVLRTIYRQRNRMIGIDSDRADLENVIMWRKAKTLFTRERILYLIFSQGEIIPDRTGKRIGGEIIFRV